MELKTEYSVSPDMMVKVTTLIATLLPYTLFGIVFAAFLLNGVLEPMILALIAVLTIINYTVLIWIAWAYSPQKYILSPLDVEIVRPAGNIKIDVSKIKKVDAVSFNPLALGKIFSNAGLFSFTGKFYSPQYGKIHMYAKNRNYVLIHADKKYVLSPDNREMFLMQLQGYTHIKK